MTEILASDFSPDMGIPIVGLFDGMTVGICNGKGGYERLDHLLVRVCDDCAPDSDYELLEAYCLWIKEELFVAGEVLDEGCELSITQHVSKIRTHLT